MIQSFFVWLLGPDLCVVCLVLGVPLLIGVVGIRLGLWVKGLNTQK